MPVNTRSAHPGPSVQGRSAVRAPSARARCPRPALRAVAWLAGPAAAVVLLTACPASAAPLPLSSAAGPGHTSGAPPASGHRAARVQGEDGRGFAALAGLSAERLELADRVAAAKLRSGTPVADPARERVVLEEAARKATARGLDPVVARRVFRDQIEASKAVQRGLLQRWRAHPEQRPTGRPDLAGEVRPALDRITTGLIDALTEVAPRRGTPGCRAALTTEAAGQAVQRRFDPLHSRGLSRALASVC